MKSSTTPNDSVQSVTTQAYNGWRNYETWCVHLWLTNDEPSYRHVNQIVQHARHTSEAAERIQALVTGLNPLAKQATLYTDLLNGALREVDWFEIAQAFLED